MVTNNYDFYIQAKNLRNHGLEDRSLVKNMVTSQEWTFCKLQY